MQQFKIYSPEGTLVAEVSHDYVSDAFENHFGDWEKKNVKGERRSVYVVNQSFHFGVSRFGEGIKVYAWKGSWIVPN